MPPLVDVTRVIRGAGGGVGRAIVRWLVDAGPLTPRFPSLFGGNCTTKRSRGKRAPIETIN
jgi:hypothetical protein